MWVPWTDGFVASKSLLAEEQVISRRTSLGTTNVMGLMCRLFLILGAGLSTCLVEALEELGIAGLFMALL